MPVTVINDHSAIDSAIEQSCQRAGEHFLRTAGRSDQQYTVLLTTDDAVRELNRTYRHIDKPTNVLSFPFEISEDEILAVVETNELGDIAISCDRAQAEAREYECTFQQRLHWLIVHGFLHLLGYDHETSSADADIMYRLEEQYLSALPAG